MKELIGYIARHHEDLEKSFSDELAVLDYTPIGASALCALGATHYVCPRQTAEEQSAAFALISELLDANCLDYLAAAHECGQ